MEKLQIREWKNQHDKLKDEIPSQYKSFDSMREDIAVLSEEIEKWAEIAGKMREDYEEAIHLLTPEIMRKHWVDNIEKKARCVNEI